MKTETFKKRAMTKEELIEKHPRIFKRMSAATHDLEICVRFVKCEEKHLLKIDKMCYEVQSYIDYMNLSNTTKIPQVFITDVLASENTVFVIFSGGDEYTTSLLGGLQQPKK